jgi:uncharacterized protein (DUF2252 family)
VKPADESPKTPPSPKPRAVLAVREERVAQGKALRERHPREALADAPRPDDPARDPIAWHEATNAGRVPELIALRHERMAESPFTFYRGAAAVMAHDLGPRAHSGCFTQLCGDAHCSNFGFFASPERSLLFDLNDFDETLPGPFDWDLRRLAASFVIAARDIGLKDRHARDAVWMLAEAYRDRLRRFAEMDTLDAWYYRLTAETLLELGKEDAAELRVIKKARKATSRVFAEAAIDRMAGEGGATRCNIRDQPPFVYHDAKATKREIGRFERHLRGFLATYRESLAPERRVLLDRYALHDIAVLTPGVGSVGRRCFLLLLVADGEHPLFLQCKEAVDSVLEGHLGRARLGHGGERVVQGQRLLQAASDIFLGWAGSEGLAGEFYVRQLRDMKASYDLESFTAMDLIEFAEACGYGLARAHAKAGDAARTSGWIGRSDRFNRALVAFATTYADVNEADWQRFTRSGLPGVKGA